MIRLNHEFVRPRRGLSVPGAVLLALGMLIPGASVLQYLAVSRDIAELERRLDTAARGAVRGVPTELGVEQLRARILFASQVMKKKTIPWDELFRDIEDASNSKIGVLSIEPEAVSGVVRVNGEALDMVALSEYIERLESKAALRNVHLVAHELRQEQGRPVLRFGISATWVAASS